MNPEQVTALYRRLYLLFPSTWRELHEQEFLETLSEATATGTTNKIVQVIDLCWLALVLRQRQLHDSLTWIGCRPIESRLTSPVAGVFGLAVLLSCCAYRWGGHVSIEFIVTSTLVVLVPGIGVFYTISNAIAGGRDQGITAATGCTLGIVPHLIVAFLGLSGIMQLGATVFEVVRWAGVAYLAWMGVCMLRQQPGFQFSQAEEPGDRLLRVNARAVISRGILLNMLNPKLTLFFFAFLPQFLSANGPGTGFTIIDLQLLGLGSLFMLLTLVCFVLYALAGAALRHWVSRSPTCINLIQRTFGVSLIGFATRLAVAER